MFPKKADAEKLAGRIPPVVISTQELQELKIVKDPGEWVSSSSLVPTLHSFFPCTQLLEAPLSPLVILEHEGCMCQ